MAKPKKTKSGSWRVQVYDYTDDQGKIHLKSITCSTKAQAEYEAGRYKKEKKRRSGKEVSLTVAEAIDRYLDLAVTLSPTTVQAYRKIRQYAFQSIMNLEVDKITDTMMQTAINEESLRKSSRTGKALSPKTVKNEWGLIASALKSTCDASFRIRLPKVQHKNSSLPRPDEIMAAIVGSPVELPCLLAMWLSFSMSEIRGLMCSSVRRGYIYIDQVVVDVAGMAITKKDAKTDTRIRRQRLPERILELIYQDEGYLNYKKTGEDCPLVRMSRSKIYYHFTHAAAAIGLTDLSFHDLRHVFASVMLTELRVPEKVVQEEGGWSTPHVMKRIYSQTFSDSREKADDLRDNYFQQIWYNARNEAL